MTIRKFKQRLSIIAPIDNTSRPARLSGISWAAADTQISKDGGSFTNTSNSPSEIGTTGRYSLTLTADEMNADVVHLKVERSDIDPIDKEILTSGEPTGTVVADGSNTATTFETSLSETDDDYWKDALLLFTSGALINQVKKITAYNGTSKFVTLGSALTATPSDGDRFVIINL